VARRNAARQDAVQALTEERPLGETGQGVV